jgi:hypothetical protein
VNIVTPFSWVFPSLEELGYPGSRELNVRKQRCREGIEIREGLERVFPFGKVVSKARDGEDSVRRERGTAIRVAVADVDDLAGRQRRALAGLAAFIAIVRVPPLDTPAVGPRVDPVRVERDFNAFALEKRADQLLEAARDDVHVPPLRLRPADEAAESRPNPGLLERPRDDLFERRGDRLELARDHVSQRKAPSIEPGLDLRVDGGVAELECRPVEEVGDGDRAVEVEDDRASAQR